MSHHWKCPQIPWKRVHFQWVFKPRPKIGDSAPLSSFNPQLLKTQWEQLLRHQSQVLDICTVDTHAHALDSCTLAAPKVWIIPLTLPYKRKTRPSDWKSKYWVYSIVLMSGDFNLARVHTSQIWLDQSYLLLGTPPFFVCEHHSWIRPIPVLSG